MRGRVRDFLKFRFFAGFVWLRGVAGGCRGQTTLAILLFSFLRDNITIHTAAARRLDCSIFASPLSTFHCTYICC
ncbi:hypothetical protein CMV_005726 [Castanea mollissima]|uniref:Uncharacterized protein n=1 Tax=Castanea mollissima TaxID=60419 RepID=A0A8J4RQ89_9ROSI|nr:hypothetical protein CMV_005726 [Castanea mollissima]